MICAAVRDIDTKIAVGIFCAPSLDSLWIMVDAYTEPSDCEYRKLKRLAIAWPDRDDVPKIGVEREMPEDTDLDEHPEVERLRSLMMFDYEAGDLFYSDMKSWKRFATAIEPGGILHTLRSQDVGAEQ